MSGNPERGFTLLELLVVIAVMAALAAAFPLALNRFVPARRLDAAAHVLLADIRQAQARSVSSNHPVVLEVSGHGYHIEAGVLRQWNESTSIELRSADDARTLTALRVFPDGSTTGGRFVIRIGERALDVFVSPLTGRVTVGKPT